MNSRITLIVPTLLATLATPANADDFQQWAQLGAKVDLSNKVALQDELIARFSDNRSGLYEIENSLLLGYKLSTKITVWAGYVHNPNYNAGNFAVMERRAREQITFDNFAQIGAVSLSGRLRMEQRWRDEIDGTGWRTRPYLKFSLPLGGTTAPTLNLSEEAFVNLSNTSFQSKDGLERLRTVISLSLPVSKVVRLEGGYLNQHRFITNGPDTDDHALTVSASLSF